MRRERRAKTVQQTTLEIPPWGLCTVAVICASAALCTSNVEAAEASSIFPLLPSPSLTDLDGRLAMKLPPVEFAIGVVFGLALALLSVYRFAVRGPAFRPQAWYDDEPFARYGHARALLLNGFVWVYVALVVGFAGLIYSGVFHLIRARFAQTMPELVSWGPAAPVLATFAWTLLSRHFSWLKTDGGVEAVVDSIEGQTTEAGKSHWVSTLAWSKVEAAREARSSELAYLYSVGFVQYALGCHCGLARDRGRLASHGVDETLNELDTISAGDDERSRFANRRLAIEIASRVVPLDKLEDTLRRYERRKADRRVRSSPVPEGVEKREGADRRVDGALVLEAA